jgi:2-phosphosulfolactate phosphatase
MTFDRTEWDIHFEWGFEGVSRLAPVSDVVIIVDVLSFSTCVEIAVSRGAAVLPYPKQDSSLEEYARLHAAQPAATDRCASGAFSLSPQSLLTLPSGYRLVLPSPNGAMLCKSVGNTRTLAGCLRNGRAVAQAAKTLGRTVAVIAAGERWPNGSLRPCLEDQLGAGAILQNLPGRRSPEAEAAVAVFEKFSSQLESVLMTCISGRELIERGFKPDVALAAECNISSTVPILVNSAFVAQSAKEPAGPIGIRPGK